MSAPSPPPSDPPWYADGLRFGCTRCGHCCQGPDPGYVEVGLEEIERLAAHLELTPSEFGRRYLRRTYDHRVALVEYPNNDCIFWVRGEGCSVYPARPDQCRTFPFWPEMVATPEAWAAEAARCPGMDRGPRYARRRIEAILAGREETAPGHRLRPDPPAGGRRLRTVDPADRDSGRNR